MQTLPQEKIKVHIFLRAFHFLNKALYSIRCRLSDVFRAAVIRLLGILPLKNYILFESMTEYDGSTGLVFESLCNDSAFRNMKFIWIIKSREITEKQNKGSKAVNVRNGSLLSLYYFAVSKIVILENTIAFANRKHQLSIYISHGFPIKNVRGKINVCNNVKYVCCASENYSDIQEYQFSYAHEKTIYVGLPRNDLLLRNFSLKNTDLFADVNYRKIIVWLPTFRSLSTGRSDSQAVLKYDIPIIENDRDIFKLDKLCKESSVLLIIKPHPFSKRGEKIKADNIVTLYESDLAKNGFELYSLLAASDALITDYSSVSLDYLLADKPIAYTVDDMDDYTLGFSVPDPFAFMHGNKLSDMAALCSFINEVSCGIDNYADERNDFKDKFWGCRQNNSTEKFCRFLKERLDDVDGKGCN